ncbi:LysM peptidoglycan-binding domain-containing protein [Neobacillus pocheonensis]|uniref:LysM peptidoglycan-binding domain-containing protein n=1 Tax=Neobacillus pocheonensis TaxID=363869 RepID=A0ABT0WAF5_9BACI|nr:LysM peptidoglycan-binding domain-containing protein [Neobacillus pocheonensis]
MKKLWNQFSYAIILIVLSCSVALMISLHIESDDQNQYIKVTVSEGDSLWKISNQFSGQHSLSKDEFVSWVKKHNEIEDDQIFPGEEIVIPVSKKVSSLAEFASAAGE